MSFNEEQNQKNLEKLEDLYNSIRISNDRKLNKVCSQTRKESPNYFYLYIYIINGKKSFSCSQHTYFLDIKTAGSCGDKCSKN